MNVLVVGGAGYIGSHAVARLIAAGHKVVVLDNLSRGHAAAVPDGALIRGDLNDTDFVENTLRDHSIDVVMHFAAFAEVGESVKDPAAYYQNNVVAALSLLEAMRRADVKKIVFSSTTATYGQPDTVPIAESTPQNPINPYGFTKLVIERALADYAHAYGFAYAALRYFNAAGAHPDGHIGEHHDPESHLIPIVLQVALGQRESITIFGDDYPTPDGTCIRDYIHVEDLADAHLRAMDRLEPGQGICVNLGTGKGISVREIIEACREVTGHEIPVVMGDRRPGDPAELVADARLAEELLDWNAKYTDVKEVVDTAWRWHQSHPRGYDS
ncbi:UDP-glucose 4-epimerase GalE [Allorhodopirellula heiligendammensis]|uniref:UDP-glucose 4-epimerase n=1 Tax=Allorhodopirellula heiligendammensis TaxID=2714739 RepID=A0A5C6BSD4_9BACT|nr:UDP-glucose 4-epimerase GalE [Allorhodopirellula heiligendammensis]TWU15153.1 UDP-glucose 4-epimerase [Allorhodopirellula heiligendammensis]